MEKMRLLVGWAVMIGFLLVFASCSWPTSNLLRIRKAIPGNTVEGSH